MINPPVFTKPVPPELVRSLLAAALDQLPRAAEHPQCVGLELKWKRLSRAPGRLWPEASVFELRDHLEHEVVPLMRVEGLPAELDAAQSLMKALQAWRERVKQGKRRAA